MRILRAFAFSALLGAASAQAAVVFNNFGPGDSFNTGIGWIIGGSLGTAQGDQFVAGASGDVTDIFVVLGNSFGRTRGDVTITLRSDAGDTPGTILESFVIDDDQIPTSSGSSTPTTIHVAATGDTHLLSGTAYWLIAQADATEDFPYAWFWNSQGDSGLHFCSPGCSTTLQTNTHSVFRIEAAGIPEPSIIALVALALAGLGFSRRSPTTN